MALSLTLKEITICAVMLGFCHSLLVELPISQRLVAPWAIFLVALAVP